MRRQSFRPIGLAVACLLFAGCSPTTEAVLRSNVEVARNRWVASSPQDYSFDIQLTCECLYSSLHVQVTNRAVVAATDPAGIPATHFSMTLEDVWSSILRARDNGSLHSASFDQNGVPLAADFGDLSVDAGARYSVTNYHRTR